MSRQRRRCTSCYARGMVASALWVVVASVPAACEQAGWEVQRVVSWQDASETTVRVSPSTGTVVWAGCFPSDKALNRLIAYTPVGTERWVYRPGGGARVWPRAIAADGTVVALVSRPPGPVPEGELGLEAQELLSLDGATGHTTARLALQQRDQRTAVSRDGRVVMALGADPRVLGIGGDLLCKLRNASPPLDVWDDTEDFRFELSPDGSCMVAAYYVGASTLWQISTTTGRREWELELLRGCLCDLTTPPAFSETGRYLVLGGGYAERSGELRDLTGDADLAAQLGQEPSLVNEGSSLTVLATRPEAVSAGPPRPSVIWAERRACTRADRAAGMPACVPHLVHAAISEAPGGLILAASYPGTVSIRRLDTSGALLGAVEVPVPEGVEAQLAICPGEQTVMAAGADPQGALHVLTMDTDGHALGHLTTRGSSVREVFVSADGRSALVNGMSTMHFLARAEMAGVG